jgi:IclR family transcriptional regulator, mhp operon transcriptional activator
MPKPETIRGLERGLQVLQFLQANPISSLHNIYLATDISKPSLLRILQTLEQFGLVSRRLADGHYRISSFVRPTRKRDRYDRVAEAAAPVLDRLCHKVSWPSDLFVPAGDHMERRETSRSLSPYINHPGYMIRIGQPVNWLLTGVGRAYLAFCPDRVRESILQRLRRSDQPEDRLARDPKQTTRFSRRRVRKDMARALRVSSAVSTAIRKTMGSQVSLFRCGTVSACMDRSISCGSGPL